MPSSSKEDISFFIEKSLFDVKGKVVFYPPNFPNPKTGLCIWPNRDVEFSRKIFHRLKSFVSTFFSVN